MPDPEEMPGPRKQDPVRRLARPAVALARAIVFQVRFASVFADVLHHPVLHQAPVAGRSPLAQVVSGYGGRTVRLVAEPTAGAARAALTGGQVHAAVIAGPEGDSLLIQTAASPGTADVLTKGTTAAAALKTPPRVRDLAPLPASDSAGTSLIFLVTAWMLGGHMAATPVGVMLSGMRSPGLRQAAIRLGRLAGYAVLSGLLGVLLIGPALGVVPGYSLPLAGTLLTLAATAWRRHRPASRAPQGAAQAAAAASLAS
jgi:hypothetical protein